MNRTPLWSAIALSLVFAACGDDAGVDTPDLAMEDGGPSLTDGGDPDMGEPPPAPMVASVSPTNVALGSPLMVNGSGFVAITEVSVGGTAQAYAIGDEGTIQIAAVDDATPLGEQDVVVTGDGGTSAPSPVTVLSHFAVSGAASVDPTTVTVSFNRAPDPATVDVADFTIGDLEVTAVSVDGDTVRLTTGAQTPATSYTLTIAAVDDTYGNALTGMNAAVFPGFEPTLPQITGVTPGTAVVGHSTLTIAGVNLVGASVTVGGVAQPVASASATEVVTGALDPTTPTGSQDVQVSTPTGDSGTFAIDVLEPFTILMAESTGPTEVLVTTNRAADPASVDASRFSVSALTVTDATATGTVLTLTTSEQVPGDSYVVGADAALVDMNGAPVTSTNVSFTGFEPPLPMDVVVVRVGDGISSLDSSTAAAVVLEQRRIADGSVAATVPLPVAASGANLPFTLPGTGFTNRFMGTLSRSPDGQSVALLGYQLTPGTAIANGARVVAVIDAGDLTAPGGIDTSTTIGTRFSTTSPRGAATDGTNVWVVGGFGGIHHTTIGSTSEPTAIAGVPSSGRAVDIYGGQLFYSSSDGTSGQLLNQVGTGTPTTAATTTPVYSSGTPSPAGFVALDLDPAEAGIDTVYQADMSAGLLRFHKTGGVWALEATFTPAVLDVACFVDGADVVCLAASSSDIYRLRDTGASSAGAAMTSIATAAASTEFRGVAITPGAP